MYEWLQLENFKALLAGVVILFVFFCYFIAIIKKNEKVQDRLTNLIVAMTSIIITFYFVDGSNG